MHRDGRDLWQWSLPIGIALLAVILQWSAGAEWLRLDREHILSEPWRLLGAHFVHLGWAHLGLNLAGLALLWALLGDTLRPLWWASGVVIVALGVSLGLLYGSPAVGWYVGFSGVLHGLFAAGAVANLRRMTTLALAVLAILFVKLAAEWMGEGDPLAAAWIGGAVIVDAHLYGVIAGLVYGAILLAFFARSSSVRGA
ncbi:MAG: rhombosortase [Thioalkalivibrio sp.]|nr:MAG: rhombosortase [Thioalkalivibrio sp.]